MSSRGPKGELFSELARLARALGSAHRMEIIEFLAQGELSVDALADRTGLTVANVSQHLQLMKKAGLVVGRRASKNVVYTLADGPVVQALSALRELAEHQRGRVAELIETYYFSPGELEPIGLEQLQDRLDSGTVTLLDVRPADEFAAGHIDRAVSIPLGELSDRLGELPEDREIVAYCRGPYCVLAVDAVRILLASGRTVRRLQVGFPEWRAAGYSVGHALA